MNNPQKFKRCLMLSGGGSRFAYYLGIHAAADACQQSPDLLLASCGGAIAGAIIQGLPDSKTRKQWMLSRDMYDYLQSLQVGQHVRLFPQLLNALSRYITSYTKGDLVTHIPALFSDYLVDIYPNIPLPPTLSEGPALGIVAGRLRYGQNEVGELRKGRQLFTEVIFGNEPIRALLDGMLSPVGGERASGAVIGSTLEVMTNVPVADAVRISLADIFYSPCQRYGSHYYCGGVIDLYPLELAHALAKEVAMELKPPFSRYLANPALRTVFGFDGNTRLRHVHAQPTSVRIDTSDMERAIAPSLSKGFQWLSNRIALVPPSYGEYLAIIEAQWQYGFSRGMEGYRRNEVHAVRPRLCQRHNWSEK